MTVCRLDKFLAAASEFGASDLHLIEGVPAAYRVNGEIILADEDALSAEEITTLAAGLLNEAQREKFASEWELCISLLHPAAGRGLSTGAQSLRESEPWVCRLDWSACGAWRMALDWAWDAA